MVPRLLLEVDSLGAAGEPCGRPDVPRSSPSGSPFGSPRGLRWD